MIGNDLRKEELKMLKIDKEKCLGCGACAANCPVGAIQEKDGKYEIGEACVECGACAANCPAQAISK